MKHRHAIRPLSVISLILTYLLIALLLAFALIPIIYVIGLSFSPGSTLYMDTIFPANPTLDNYKTLLYDTQFPRWYLNTIVAGLFTSLATLVLSAPTAYAFSRLRFRGRKPFLMVLLVLQMFPGMMAMVAYYVLLNMVGLLDTTAGLVLLYSGAAVTGNTWLLKSFYDTVPKALEESAMIDGANRFQVFFKILLPLSYPMLVLVGVFAFAAPFGDFVLSRIVLTGRRTTLWPWAPTTSSPRISATISPCSPPRRAGQPAHHHSLSQPAENHGFRIQGRRGALTVPAQRTIQNSKKVGAAMPPPPFDPGTCGRENGV